MAENELAELKAEMRQMTVGVRAVSVMFTLMLAAYNAMITLRLHQATDSSYGRMILDDANTPWVFAHPWWLTIACVVLTVWAGVFGLLVRNHLRALTGVMVCLILMIAQMHLVAAALIGPVMGLLDDMGKVMAFR